jgi:hypothetical protein
MEMDFEQRRRLRAAATAGMIAPAAWFAVMIVLGQSERGYDALRMPASALSLGATGWVMIGNFILLGAAELLLAMGLWRSAGDSRSGRVAAALIGFAGACTLIAGPLVTDPDDALRTLHAQLHLTAVTLAFVSVSAAAIAFAHRHRDERGFARCSIVAGVSILPLFALSEAAAPFLGLIQRIAVAIALAWLTAIAARLRRSQLQA